MQSVNHLNQFTSVTFGFDTKPDVALGDVINYIQKSAAEVLPPTVKGELQGEGFGPPATLSGAAVSDHRGRIRHVCHPRHSLRELCASRYCAFDSIPRCRGWPDDPLAVQQHTVALLSHRIVPLDGYREEERDHDRGLCAASSR